ncbi:hypothetical protein ACPXB1_22505 [Micromonospora sp. DT68]|uniref:hypothetical protein n=1 Tax=Micromonospora sp. DT68 TaxID=3416522 RepID=UPI003CF69868
MPRTRTYPEPDMILPTLVSQVLASAYPGADVQPSAIRGMTHTPEVLPAVRLRPRGNAWSADGRMTGRLVVVTFIEGSTPMVIDPMSLVDPTTGDVLPRYMAGLDGVSMKLRTVSRKRIGNKVDHLPTYAAHYWGCAVTL